MFPAFVPIAILFLYPFVLDCAPIKIEDDPVVVETTVAVAWDICPVIVSPGVNKGCVESKVIVVGVTSIDAT